MAKSKNVIHQIKAEKQSDESTQNFNEHDIIDNTWVLTVDSQITFKYTSRINAIILYKLESHSSIVWLMIALSTSQKNSPPKPTSFIK